MPTCSWLFLGGTFIDATAASIVPKASYSALGKVARDSNPQMLLNTGQPDEVSGQRPDRNDEMNVY